jgi:hypothetical protein
MKSVMLIVIGLGIAIASISALAGEPPKPTCRNGEKFDNQSKRCIPAP